MSTAPGPPYRKRYDLTPDGKINIFDVNRMAPPVALRELPVGQAG